MAVDDECGIDHGDAGKYRRAIDELTATQRRVQRWFRAKRRELLASADLAQDHPTLVGGHREFFLREFLGHFLPRRLSAGRGIVYNFAGHSGECDVVIWDSANYPTLTMLDHSSFFVESVVCVVEVKSTYSHAEFSAALQRGEELRRMSLTGMNASRFRHELEYLRAQALALEHGVDFGGISFAEPRMGYAVVFLRGGATVDLDGLFSEHADELHDVAPDLVTFVEAGISIRKWNQTLGLGARVSKASYS